MSKDEMELVGEVAIPIKWSPAERRQKNVDAGWTKKEGKSNYGYRVSANGDNRYKLMRKIIVSTASEQDTLHFEGVRDPTNTNRDALADKGYVDGEREPRLNQQGWRMCILRKGSKDKLIPETQKRSNTRIAKIRARVENVFARLTQLDGKGFRSIGLARATLQLNWKVAAYSLRRLVYSKEAPIDAF